MCACGTNQDARTTEEDQILVQERERLGNKWTEISSSLPGRSVNDVKNHWYSMSRRTQSQGDGAAPDFGQTDAGDSQLKGDSASDEPQIAKRLRTDDPISNLPQIDRKSVE